MDKIKTPATDALDAVNAKYEFFEAPGAISGEDYSKAIGGRISGGADTGRVR